MNATLAAGKLKDFVGNRIHIVALCFVVCLPLFLLAATAVGIVPFWISLIGLATLLLVSKALYTFTQNFLLTSVRMNAMARVTIVAGLGVASFFAVGTALWAYLLTGMVVWLFAAQLCGTVGTDELRALIAANEVAATATRYAKAAEDRFDALASHIDEDRDEDEFQPAFPVGLGVTAEDAAAASK